MAAERAGKQGMIFDYGGTLDSRGEHWSHVIRRGYKAAGLELDDEVFRRAYVHGERTLAKERHILPHHTFRELMEIKVAIELEALVADGAVEASAAAAAAGIISGYCYESARRCVRESEATLRRFKEAGVPMVLVSNFYGNIHAVLDDFGIGGYFGSVIESAVVGVRKPDPRIFSLGVEALEMEARNVVVVGDSYRKDILPALQTGCRAFWLRGEGWDDSESSILYPDSVQNLGQVADVLLT